VLHTSNSATARARDSEARGSDSPRLEDNCHGFIALVAVLLLSAFAAHEGRKGLAFLAIMLGVFALIACVTYSARILGIG
jgi:hypothetical protein